MSFHRILLGSRTPLLLPTSRSVFSGQPYYNFLSPIKNIRYTRTPQRFQSRFPKRNVEEQLATNYAEKMLPSHLVRPFLFTVGVSTASLVGVTIWEYEYIRGRVKKMMNSSITFLQQRERNVSDLQAVIARFKNGELKEAWGRLSAGDQFFIPILAANALVFGLWRIRSVQGLMLKYFCANPVGQAPCRSMFLSMFSHYSFFHIFANMYVLHSFSSAACASLGKEQTVAFYLTAGCFASFASYAYKVFTGVSGSSLGASGAILGILAYVCTRFPDTQLQIMFLPMFQFSAENAIKTIMAFDLLGCILGWKFFDHAAHLGGAAFGLLWCLYGEQYIWGKRKYITEQWHNFRTKTCD